MDGKFEHFKSELEKAKKKSEEDYNKAKKALIDEQRQKEMMDAQASRSSYKMGKTEQGQEDTRWNIAERSAEDAMKPRTLNSTIDWRSAIFGTFAMVSDLNYAINGSIHGLLLSGKDLFVQGVGYPIYDKIASLFDKAAEPGDFSLKHDIHLDDNNNLHVSKTGIRYQNEDTEVDLDKAIKESFEEWLGNNHYTLQQNGNDTKIFNPAGAMVTKEESKDLIKNFNEYLALEANITLTPPAPSASPSA